MSMHRRIRRGFGAAILCASVTVLTACAGSEARTQIPAGTAAALGSAKGPAADSPQSQMLDNALSPATRSTLQTAMDSAPAK